MDFYNLKQECCVCEITWYGAPHSVCSQACYDIEQQVMETNSHNPPKTMEEFRQLIKDGAY